jgi:NTP pyrophosphatase (non-canonical NTP hydrolase)
MELRELQDKVNQASVDAGWWEGVDVDDITPTKLCLIHSEISEAMEGHRKGLMDDHLPHRPMMEVELADALIRILDLAGAWGYDLEEAVAEKMAYNKQRQDHKQASREATGGKRY